MIFDDSELVTWFASYPKSGNTWVRLLVDAYRHDGAVNINDLTTGFGDSAVTSMRLVSPADVDSLSARGQFLLRPAALMVTMWTRPSPRILKTHFANLIGDDMPPFIPIDLTQRAVHIVRDPRSVLLSFAYHYDLSLEKSIEYMGKEDAVISGDLQTRQFISSWTTHVNSWLQEMRYPVLTVKYEDLLHDAVSELCQIVRFLGLEVDEQRAARAVDACELSKIRHAEQSGGFKERYEDRAFFNKGGIRWQDELPQHHIDKIITDHGDMMKRLGYLEA